MIDFKKKLEEEDRLSGIYVEDELEEIIPKKKRKE